MLVGGSAGLMRHGHGSGLLGFRDYMIDSIRSPID